MHALPDLPVHFVEFSVGRLQLYRCILDRSDDLAGGAVDVIEMNVLRKGDHGLLGVVDKGLDAIRPAVVIWVYALSFDRRYLCLGFLCPVENGIPFLYVGEAWYSESRNLGDALD